MAKQTKRINTGVNKNTESIMAIQYVSENELNQFLTHIMSLQLDLQHFPLLDHQFVAEVIATQDLLTRCRDLVESAIVIYQRRDTYNQLCNWDNEGGQVGLKRYT